MSKLEVKRENGLVQLMINRPEKRNAIDYDVMEALDQVLTEINENEEDKLVIVRGVGTEAFCSGGDLSIFHGLRTKDEAYSMLSKMGEILFKLFFLEKPTVAALNGTAVGGGCEIATACDFRIASSHVKVGFVQGTLGITTGWGGSTMLIERFKKQTAMEMLMTCQRYSAKQAFELGFIQRIFDEDKPFDEAIMHYINPFIRQSTSVLAAYKKRWIDQFDKDEVKARFKREIDECSTLWASDEHHEAVERFLSKNNSNK